MNNLPTLTEIKNLSTPKSKVYTKSCSKNEKSAKIYLNRKSTNTSKKRNLPTLTDISLSRHKRAIQEDKEDVKIVFKAFNQEFSLLLTQDPSIFHKVKFKGIPFILRGSCPILNYNWISSLENIVVFLARIMGNSLFREPTIQYRQFLREKHGYLTNSWWDKSFKVPLWIGHICRVTKTTIIVPLRGVYFLENPPTTSIKKIFFVELGEMSMTPNYVCVQLPPPLKIIL